MNLRRTRQPIHEGARRLSVAHFLIALIVLFVAMPFLDQFSFGDIAESILITAVLLLAVTAVGGRRRTFIIAAVLVVPAVAARWIAHFWPHVLLTEIRLLAAMFFVAFVSTHLARFILMAPVVNSEVMCAAVAAYLMLAVFWAFVYEFVALLIPNAFAFTLPADPHQRLERFEALYFSMGALTGLDFGDIVPLANPVRMLTMLEAVAGVFFLAILIARLVSLYSAQRRVSSLQRRQE